MNDHSFLDAVQPIFVICSILKTEQVQYLSHFHFAQYLRQAHVACQGPRNRIAQIGQYLGFIKQPHIWWAESVQLTKFHRRTWLISSDTENLWVSSYWSTSVNWIFLLYFFQLIWVLFYSNGKLCTNSFAKRRYSVNALHQLQVWCEVITVTANDAATTTRSRTVCADLPAWHLCPTLHCHCDHHEDDGDDGDDDDDGDG